MKLRRGADEVQTGRTVFGTGTVNSEQATFSTSTLAAGPQSLTVSYGGDVQHASFTSAALSQTVKQGVDRHEHYFGSESVERRAIGDIHGSGGFAYVSYSKRNR